MYCPECEGEYRKGIEICPTCEVSLVAELPGPDEPHGGGADAGGGHVGARIAPPYVDLVPFLDEAEARAARRKLKEERIPSELVIRDGEPGESGEPAEECWIRVPGSAVRAAELALQLDQELGEDACTICGAPFGPDGVCQKCAGAHGA